jgi:hypothetical protein
MEGSGKESDWANSSANLLGRMVARNGVGRTIAERGRLTPDYLFVLAITDKISPDGSDRAWLRRVHPA